MSRYRPKIRVVPLGSAAWQRLRAHVLAEEPLCRDCMARGLVTPATDVDHIDNNGDNNTRANLAPLCHSCHSIKTAQDMGKQTTRGHDARGFPLDPNHPWNREADAPIRCDKKSPGTAGS